MRSWTGPSALMASAQSAIISIREIVDAENSRAVSVPGEPVLRREVFVSLGCPPPHSIIGASAGSHCIRQSEQGDPEILATGFCP